VKLRFGTYNLLDAFASNAIDERTRLDGLIQVIRDLRVDVLAVQEITATNPDDAATRLETLAEATGLTCRPEPGQTAVAIGSQRHHVGLLWNPALAVVPGSFRTYGRADFWHSLAKLTFDIDGRQIVHASHHAGPFGPRQRADQMVRVVSALNRPASRRPGLVGADWNSIAADRVERDGRWAHYDHDPYVDQPWSPDLISQTTWAYDEHGHRIHVADREPGEVLWAGGLHDTAAALDAPWTPTVGHWPDDPFPPRRIDGIRCTSEVLSALISVETIATALTKSTSDHLPVVLTYDTDNVLEES
jgi:endonuclease/exonuclease/phosphatase family metal-dependent hydrolase